MAIKVINNIIDRLFIILFVLLLGIGAYCIIDSIYLQRVGMANSVYRPTKDNPTEYMKIGPECVGWITIKDTKIDYPIMQAKDNIKYLNTAPDGSYSLAGSIFLDFQNKSDFSDDYNLVYGHHMEDNMFGHLDAFAEEKYYEAHKEAELTCNGEVHDARVFGFLVVDANEKTLFDVSFDGQYEYIKEHATYFEEPVDKDTIVCLSTCRDPGSTKRTVVLVSFVD